MLQTGALRRELAATREEIIEILREQAASGGGVERAMQRQQRLAARRFIAALRQ